MNDWGGRGPSGCQAGQVTTTSSSQGVLWQPSHDTKEGTQQRFKLCFPDEETGSEMK